MIEINNLTTNKIDEEFLKKIVNKILLQEIQNKKDYDLSIVFVGKGRIKKLNKKYRKKNRVTDVLTFSFNETQNKIQNDLNLGEIVICLKEIKKNAKKYGISFKSELIRVLIHGVLHILGYDHEISLQKTKEMEQKEDYYQSIIKHLN